MPSSCRCAGPGRSVLPPSIVCPPRRAGSAPRPLLPRLSTPGMGDRLTTQQPQGGPLVVATPWSHVLANDIAGTDSARRGRRAQGSPIGGRGEAGRCDLLGLLASSGSG